MPVPIVSYLSLSQPLFGGLYPRGYPFVLLPKKSPSHRPQMLSGVPEVQKLDRYGPMLLCQCPYPRGAIEGAWLEMVPRIDADTESATELQLTGPPAASVPRP